MTSGNRTALLALLVIVVGIRVSSSRPLSPAMMRITSDPGAQLHHAADGWTLAGTMGGASAQGLRDMPLTLLAWLGARLGSSAEIIQTSWLVLVLLIALIGAIRLARAFAPEESIDSWRPWFAAIVFSCGIVVVPTVVRSPLDGLAAAALPWIVAPLLTGRIGWRQAATSAAWLGVAGVGSPIWAAGALLAAIVAATPRSREQVLPALRWLALALLGCAWWAAAYFWEVRHATDVSVLMGGVGPLQVLTDAVGRPALPEVLLVLGVLGPLLVCASCLVLRPPGALIGFGAGLCVSSAVVVGAWFAGWSPPVFTPPGGDAPATMLGPVLGWISLAALVGWTPLLGLLSARTQRPATPMHPSGRPEFTALGIGAAVLLTSVAGLVAAGAEPGNPPASRAHLLAEVSEWSGLAPQGRVLLLSAHSEDTWIPSLGAALGNRPWVGRSAVPASGAATTSALDDLLRRLDRGDGGPGTASALKRLGIAHVLLHLDGSVATDRAKPAGLVRAALAGQGGRRTVVLSAGGGDDDRAPAEELLDFGVRGQTEQVEVWSLPGAADGWTHEGAPVDVAGDVGTASDLADAGALGSRAIRIRGDSKRTELLSDSARRRDVDQRLPVEPYGPDLEASEARSVVPPGAAPGTTASRRFSGARTVSASSSAADLDGAHREAGTDAGAAIDANVSTAWQSRRGTGEGEWWQVDLDSPTALSGSTVQFVRNAFQGQPVTRVRVTTDEGVTDYDVPADGLVALQGAETTSRLRITVTGAKGTGDAHDSVGIAEVTIPNVAVRDSLVVAGPTTASWLLAARPGSFTRCVPAVQRGDLRRQHGELPTACDAGLVVAGTDTGSLHRVIELAEPSVITGRAWARAAASGQSAALAARLARPTITVTGSSVAAPDLVARPQAAADTDSSTVWRPAPEDARPVLTLTWSEPAEVSGLELELLTGVASTPTRVQIAAQVQDAGSVTTEVDIDQEGNVTFPRVRTRSITVTFLEDTQLTSVGSLLGGYRHAPIGVAEIRLVGAPEVAYDADTVHELGCGSGPVVSLGGTKVATAISTTARDVVEGGLVRADLCGKVGRGAGEVEVGVAASYSWIPLGMLLTLPEAAIEPVGADVLESSSDDVAAIPATLIRLGTRGSVTLDLETSSTERTMTLAVPAASGWQAKGAHGPLEPVTVAGWTQGWVVPSGVSEVELSYSAGASLRESVGVGAVAWVLVLLLALGGALPAGRWDHRMAGRSTHA